MLVEKRFITTSDFNYPDDETSISIPTGTASALINLGNEWVEIDLSQAWFWTDEWQARHHAAITELESGDYVEFENGDDFIASLDNDENE